MDYNSILMNGKIFFAFLMAVVFFFHPIGQLKASSENTIEEAKIIEIRETRETKEVMVKILTGKLKNRKMTVKDKIIETPYQLSYQKGDTVIVTVSSTPDGKTNVYISDIDRRPVLILLFVLFVLAVAIVSRIQGISSLIGMAISFYIITGFMIPNIIEGSDPLAMAGFSSLIVIPATFYLAHGVNRKTNIAVFSSFITLLFSGGIAYLFVNLARLTGMTTDEAMFLSSSASTSQINIKSLFLGGIIIGFLAILDDITVSQASIVERLDNANPKLSFRELYDHAMIVGRDHVASMVNTLILVYVGASFPLVLLFYNTTTPLSLIANQEIIAAEIVRTLVGSIGVIAAVPISTYLSCIITKKR